MALYKPCPSSSKEGSHTFSKNQWQKITTSVAHNQSEYSPVVNAIPETQVEIKTIKVDKYLSVFVGGEHPRLIIKNTASPPIILDLRSFGMMSMTSFHTPKCERGFVYLSQKVSGD